MNTLTPSRRNVMRALAAITTGLPTLAYATPAATAIPAFDPADWLARYIDLGGGYSVVSDAIWLHCSLNGDVDEQALRAHEAAVRRYAVNHAAVKALILHRYSREMVDG